MPNFSCTRNSPSITGMRQKRSPPITLLAWKPSPKKRSARAHADPVRRVGQPVEAGRGRAGEHRLADALDQPLAQVVLAHRHEQHADAGPAVGRLASAQLALDPRLALAADDRRGEAGELERRLARPARASAPVMTSRAARMVNASANVSSMKTPRIFIAAPHPSATGSPGSVLHRDSCRTTPMEYASKCRRTSASDRVVVARRHVQPPAGRRAAELPLLDDQRAALET